MFYRNLRNLWIQGINLALENSLIVTWETEIG
jgi:hypothetical protein